jgi:hypothetical protein
MDPAHACGTAVASIGPASADKDEAVGGGAYAARIASAEESDVSCNSGDAAGAADEGAATESTAAATVCAE